MSLQQQPDRTLTAHISRGETTLLDMTHLLGKQAKFSKLHLPSAKKAI